MSAQTTHAFWAAIFVANCCLLGLNTTLLLRVKKLNDDTKSLLRSTESLLESLHGK